MERFAKRFVLEDEPFASGAYGEITLARDTSTNETVVIKTIKKSTSSEMVLNEVRAGKILSDHPSIAKFRGYTDLGDQHALAFQYIDGVELYTLLESINFQPQNETLAHAIISSVASALVYAHSKGVAHRDLKLENIIVDRSGLVFLIDFGLSSIMDGKACRDWVGSNNYCPPEISRRDPYDPRLLDVFSLGIILFSLLYGVFPFEELKVNKKTNLYDSIQVRFPCNVDVSVSARNLLLGMLEDDPEYRMTMEEVLQHEWMVNTTRDMCELA